MSLVRENSGNYDIMDPKVKTELVFSWLRL